jgi:uncharacterized protein (DUF433 family)
MAANSGDLLKRIVATRDVLHGKPRINGTRIPVYQILDLLAEGKMVAEIISEDYYPDLTVDDVRACIAYASRVIQDEVVPGT